MHSVEIKADMLNINYSEFLSHLKMKYTESVIILKNVYIQASCKGPSDTRTYGYHYRLSLKIKNVEE